MFFNEPVDLGVDWSASYIGHHPVLRFVSIDNLKRGLGDQSPSSVIQSLGWRRPSAQLSGVGAFYCLVGVAAQAAQPPGGRKAVDGRHGRAFS